MQEEYQLKEEEEVAAQSINAISNLPQFINICIRLMLQIGDKKTVCRVLNSHKLAVDRLKLVAMTFLSCR